MPTGGLAPSIIAADYGRFADQLRAVAPYATRWHVDIMDGHYVPNLTIGPDFVRVIASVSDLPQDVHLMVSNPEETWNWYTEAGATRVAFHPETAADPEKLAAEISAAGAGPGIAVNPDVEPSSVAGLLGHVDHVIVMSVYPGFSGQKFIPDVLPKIAELRRLAAGSGLTVEVVVDGGVNAQTARSCVQAGADVLVAASAIFGSADPAGAAQDLRAIAAGG